MNTVKITRQNIDEYGIYEEVGVLVLGFILRAAMPYARFQFQIDVPGSAQREDAWGMYFEYDDDRGFYDVVQGFEFDGNFVEATLKPAKCLGVHKLIVEIPKDIGAADRTLLVRMVSTYKEYAQKLD